MPTTRPSTPTISHLVLNVRDIDASQRFYTDLLGFEQCGRLDVPPSSGIDMRFFRGQGSDHHHDIALIQIPNAESAPPPPDWSMFLPTAGLAHVALCYPSREEWLAQITHLQANDVEFLVRGNHGMTHSVYVADPDGHGIEVLYDLPGEIWEGDVNAALSHFEPLPTKGPEALVDRTDNVVFGSR